jgi:hypothetical protein
LAMSFVLLLSRFLRVAAVAAVAVVAVVVEGVGGVVVVDGGSGGLARRFEPAGSSDDPG